jgi:hypothetical protein
MHKQRRSGGLHNPRATVIPGWAARRADKALAAKCRLLASSFFCVTYLGASFFVC